MNKPFFSIVLPTKNRPALLRDAMMSVLLQDFADYELVVSDNFNDGRTKAVLDEFGGDSHVRYLRTEVELNIPDHWEFATKNTRGMYTLILTDRAFLGQGALKDIHDTILLEAKNTPVVFWNYGYYDEVRGILQSEKREVGAKVFNSVDLIKDFGRTLDAHYLPRPHVGCYQSDLIQKIRENLGRLYMPFGPDYTSSLLVLAYSENVLYMPRPLVFFQGAKLSAGTKAQSSIHAYLKSLNDPDPYKYVPIKAPINTSLIFNDFLKVKSLAGRNLSGIDIDWVFYFSVCYQALVEGKMIFGMAKNDQAEFLKEWRRALGLFSKPLQQAVGKELRRRRVNILKSYIRTTLVGDFLLRIKRGFLHKPTRIYESVFAAGGFVLADSQNN